MLKKLQKINHIPKYDINVCKQIKNIMKIKDFFCIYFIVKSIYSMYYKTRT